MNLLALVLQYSGILTQIASAVEKGIEVAPELWERLTANHDLVKKMVAEGRDPTQEEWDALNAGIAKDEETLQTT